MGGLGVAFVLAFLSWQIPRLVGTQAAKLDDKYFIVDVSGLVLAVGIACLVVGIALWMARSVIARLF